MGSCLNPLVFSFTLLILFSSTHVSLSLRNSILDLSLPDKSTKDIHDLLPKFGFPKGIIPNNVKSYTLSDDGSFQIELERPCYVQFENLVYYDKKITGKLSSRSVSRVSGIQAKKLFFWLSVTGIKVDRDLGMLEFYVGSLSVSLPAKQFEDIPECLDRSCRMAQIETIRVRRAEQNPS